MLEPLDPQLRWLMRNGYFTWHCWRCPQRFSNWSSVYYHLCDFHNLDPQTAFRVGEAGEPIDPADPPRNWSPPAYRRIYDDEDQTNEEIGF